MAAGSRLGHLGLHQQRDCDIGPSPPQRRHAPCGHSRCEPSMTAPGCTESLAIAYLDLQRSASQCGRPFRGIRVAPPRYHGTRNSELLASVVRTARTPGPIAVARWPTERARRHCRPARMHRNIAGPDESSSSPRWRHRIQRRPVDVAAEGDVHFRRNDACVGIGRIGPSAISRDCWPRNGHRAVSSHSSKQFRQKCRSLREPAAGPLIAWPGHSMIPTDADALSWLPRTASAPFSTGPSPSRGHRIAP